MAAPAGSAARGWFRLVLSARAAALRLPGLTQARGSRYGPEYQDPRVDKAHHRQPRAELGEEERRERERRKTQLFKAAPATSGISVFEDPAVSKFTNMMMKGGNKVLARSLMTQTLETVKRKQFEKYHAASSAEAQASIERNPYTIFHQALKNCEPVIGLVPILKGGHFYQVPVPLGDQRRRFLAMKWMITECRKKKARRMLMPEKLARELLEAFHNQGPVVKRKHDMHKMAEANRALAHYRWW